MKTGFNKTYGESIDFADETSAEESSSPNGQETESVGKSRITMRIDNDVLAIFKARAGKAGGSYQTMMNNALKEFAQGLTLTEVVRQAIRETLCMCLEEGSSCSRRRRNS